MPGEGRGARRGAPRVAASRGRRSGEAVHIHEELIRDVPVRRELRLRHPRAARPSLRARGALPAVGEGSAAGARRGGRSLAAVRPRLTSSSSPWTPGRSWRDNAEL